MALMRVLSSRGYMIEAMLLLLPAAQTWQQLSNLRQRQKLGIWHWALSYAQPPADHIAVTLGQGAHPLLTCCNQSPILLSVHTARVPLSGMQHLA